MTIKELKEQKEKDRQYREKALNYLINEKGFVMISSDDKATILKKGSFFAFVHDNKTTFQNPHNWSLSILKINHDDIENYDFIGNEIVRIGEEKEEEEPKTRLKELRERRVTWNYYYEGELIGSGDKEANYAIIHYEYDMYNHPKLVLDNVDYCEKTPIYLNQLLEYKNEEDSERGRIAIENFCNDGELSRTKLHLKMLQIRLNFMTRQITEIESRKGE